MCRKILPIGRISIPAAVLWWLGTCAAHPVAAQHRSSSFLGAERPQGAWSAGTLPPADPQSGWSGPMVLPGTPSTLGGSPGSFTAPPDDHWPPPVGRVDTAIDQGPHLRAHRDGFFQRLWFSTAYLPASRDFGIVETQTYLTVALPAPTRKHPLLITPSFRLFTLDGPERIDAPGSVFDTWLEFMWLPRLNEQWQAILSVAPGVYADFDAYGSDAIRVTGRGMARYQWVPDKFELFFGVLYLNRDDIQILPAGGVLWVPNRDWRLEFFFPKPKFARRIRWGPTFEDWAYLGAEFGGDTWWVRRASGLEDRLTLRDYRVYVGMERKRDGGAGTRLEVGYIFGRRLEYRSSPTIYNFNDTLMLRFTWMY